MPLLILLPLLALVPLAEIALFIWIGEAIGILPTLILTVGAVVLGAGLAARQGFKTLRITMESLNRGEVPVEEILSGAVLLVAAFFLMTPGFITAAIGFVLLIRPIRLWLGRLVMKRLIAARGKGGKTITLRATRIDRGRIEGGQL
jgi:UPF0716 protein FxsA